MAKILIVDDSMTSRKQIRKELEACGHVIVGEAIDGKEGYELYQKLKPDLVTMDVTMPVMDGLDSLKLIMRYDPKAVIVMVTSAGQQQTMLDAVKSGAADFIAKPFDSQQIAKTIEKALQEGKE